MKRTHSLKRSLILSLTSLILCVAMLLGTTFAWFSETITSDINTIKSGNLDVELEYYKDGDWSKVSGATDVFDPNALWEPGYTDVIYLKITNLGSLAIKYNLGVNIVDEVAGINVYDKSFNLSDYIKFGVVDVDAAGELGSREETIEAVDATANPLSAQYADSGKMEGGKNETRILALVVYMPTSVGNEANYKSGTTPPEIDLGISLVATQQAAEDDSFGPDYDEDAPWTGNASIDWYDPTKTEFTLNTPEDLAGLAALVNGTAEATSTVSLASDSTEAQTKLQDSFVGKTVKLGADVDLGNVRWTPIGKDFNNAFRGTFDGAGYTVSGLYVDTPNGVYAGLFGEMTAGVIQNLVVDGANITGSYCAGVVVGHTYSKVLNCTVKNSTVVCTPYLNANGEYEDGNNAGAIAGYVESNGDAIDDISGCTVENTLVTGFRCVGGIAGTATIGAIVSKNTVKEVTVAYVTIPVGATAAEGKTNSNIGAYVGRVINGSKVEGNEGTPDVSETAKVYTISTAEELFAFAAEVNAGNSFAGKLVVLARDIDLAGKAWTPIGACDSKAYFQGTFDGQKHTVYGLNVDNSADEYKYSTAGLFGWIDAAKATIKNVTISGATVKGSHWVGALVGYMTGDVINCHVIDSTVIGYNVNDDANGDKVGGLIGYMNSGNGNIDSCSVKATKVEGYRDVAGLAGAVATNNTVKNNRVENVTVTYTSKYAAEIVSAKTAVVIDETNVAVNVSLVIKETVGSDDDAEGALKDNDEENIVLDLSEDVSIDVTAWKTEAFGGENTKTITINGNGNTVTFNLMNSDWSHVATLGAKLIINNATIKTSGYNSGHWKRTILHFDCETELNDVVVSGTGVGFKSDAILNNVTVEQSGDNYSVWIWTNGQTVSIDKLTVNGSRGIKIADEDAEASAPKLTISNSKFTTAKKAAVLVTSKYGASVTAENVDISGCTADSVNLVWVDVDRSESYDLVKVTGGTKINEPS